MNTGRSQLPWHLSQRRGILQLVAATGGALIGAAMPRHGEAKAKKKKCKKQRCPKPPLCPEGCILLATQPDGRILCTRSVDTGGAPCQPCQDDNDCLSFPRWSCVVSITNTQTGTTTPITSSCPNAAPGACAATLACASPPPN
jgi:hypothetical protein